MEDIALLERTAQPSSLGQKIFGKKTQTSFAAARAEWRRQLKECEAELRQNECLFNLETDDLLIDSRIYEYQALLCRHRYLLEKLKG